MKVLMVLFFVVAAFCVFGKKQRLTKHDRRLIAKECIRVTGVEEEVVQEAVRTANPPENNTLYKDYLVCSYLRQGYQNENGTILYDNIRDFLLEFYSYADANSGVNSCRSLPESTPQENAFDALQCILQNLKALDENKL